MLGEREREGGRGEGDDNILTFDWMVHVLMFGIKISMKEMITRKEQTSKAK